MRLQDIGNKSVCILGFGKEGKATLKALERHAPDSKITIADSLADIDTGSYPQQTGENYLKNLDRFDLIIKSPGIPPQPEFEKVASKITNATQIFLDSAQGSGSTIIGITGSKGKSTTSALIHAILNEAGKVSFLIGNIGNPALTYIDKSSPDTFFVIEMSSYQLMDITASPHIAVLTSFFPEHLDYHGGLEKYFKAKQHITRFQKTGDTVFYNQESPECQQMAELSPGTKVAFSSDDFPLDPAETNLLGTHNTTNAAAAYKVATHLGIDSEISLKAIRTFPGLPHRLQLLGRHHEIDWVDDAISTTPESAIVALQALAGRVNTLIVGGLDRGYNFEELAKEIVSSSVENIIVLPGSGSTIQEAIEEVATRPINFFPAGSMEGVVKIAKEHTKPGTICLLSTASPSYNLFISFEDKGNQFLYYITKP